MMKRLLIAGSVIAFTAGMGALAYGATAAKFEFWNTSDLTFTEAGKGVERAILWGNPDKGDWGVLLRYKAGVERGWHTHSNALHLVMISGTFVFEVEGSAPQELGPGSGVNEIANVKHNGKCKEGADCVFLITGAKKFDFKPVKEKTAAK